MWHHPLIDINTELAQKFKKYAFIVGVVFSVLGIAALLYPFFMALLSVAFVAWFMIFAGFVAGYYTFLSYSKEWIGWLKVLILVGTGLFMLFNPLGGIQVLGLLLVIYLLLDAFANFTLASLNQTSTQWLWIFNGLISIVLAVIFLSTWGSVAAESWLIGVYVGISLLVDGIVLVLSSRRVQSV